MNANEHIEGLLDMDKILGTLEELVRITKSDSCSTGEEWVIQTVKVLVDEEPVRIDFMFLDDLTACMIHGFKFQRIDDDGNQARRRIPVNGVTLRNPKDVPDRRYAMKLACQRSCLNLDGKWKYGSGVVNIMGPVGKKIYRAFREWQRDAEI